MLDLLRVSLNSVGACGEYSGVGHSRQEAKNRHALLGIGQALSPPPAPSSMTTPAWPSQVITNPCSFHSPTQYISQEEKNKSRFSYSFKIPCRFHQSEGQRILSE